METCAESGTGKLLVCSHSQGTDPLPLHHQKSTYIPLPLMQFLGLYLGLLRNFGLQDLRCCFGSQKVAEVACTKGYISFINNCGHLLIFYYIMAVYYPEDIF